MSHCTNQKQVVCLWYKWHVLKTVICNMHPTLHSSSLLSGITFFLHVQALDTCHLGLISLIRNCGVESCVWDWLKSEVKLRMSVYVGWCRDVCVFRGMGVGGLVQVFLQSEFCMRGPESAGVIPTTYQIHMGVEPLSEVMPVFYQKHTHTQNTLVC